MQETSGVDLGLNPVFSLTFVSKSQGNFSGQRSTLQGTDFQWRQNFWLWKITLVCCPSTQLVQLWVSLLLLQNMLRQQQKVFQQARIVQSQRLKTIKQLYEQFLKVNLFLGRQLTLIISLKKAVLVQCFKLFGISLTK